jgi:ferredoxin-fold anticodon binding domain-containing protein
LQTVANRVVFDSIDYWKNQTSSLVEIEQLEKEVFSINPNPVKDNVNIIFNKALSDVCIELIDLNSKIIDKKIVSVKEGEKITLSSFGQKGSFVLTVNYYGKKISKKLVII